MRRAGLGGAILVLLVLAGGACRREPPPGGTSAAPSSHRVDESRLAMGSTLTLTAWTEDDAGARAAFDAVFKEFDRLDALMSVWRSDSDILRLNAAAGDHAVPVSPDSLEVLRIASEVSQWTEGTFDVTFGALTDVWKFDQDQDNTIPAAGQIRERLPLIDYRALIVDPRAGTAFLERPGMRAHLGGIGKGYAVDRAVKIFRERGLRDFAVQAGGDLYVAGTRGDRPWKLGIADPRAPDGPPFATIELSNSTLSTSGDYERFFMKDGVRYHHILDVRTGQPARACRSVTLVSGRAVLADAVAKGVFILGPKEGMALIERLPDIEGVIVSATNEVLVSSGLKGRLTIVHPPTDAP